MRALPANHSTIRWPSNAKAQMTLPARPTLRDEPLVAATLDQRRHRHLDEPAGALHDPEIVRRAEAEMAQAWVEENSTMTGK
jgi:hypothetical protein